MYSFTNPHFILNLITQGGEVQGTHCSSVAYGRAQGMKYSAESGVLLIATPALTCSRMHEEQIYCNFFTEFEGIQISSIKAPMLPKKLLHSIRKRNLVMLLEKITSNEWNTD